MIWGLRVKDSLMGAVQDPKRAQELCGEAQVPINNN